MESGVETENKELLKQQVLKELDAMQKGDFSDEDILSSKLSLTSALKSYYDSQSALDGWYSARLLKDDFISPDDLAKIIGGITREQIINAAKSMTLSTVYELMPNGDAI